MRDAYCEDSAVCQREVKEAKMYTLFKVLAIAAIVAAVLILSIAFAYVPAVLDATVVEETGETDTISRVFLLGTYFLTVVLAAGVGVIFWFMKNRFNVSFDYLFVEDELRISKVFNGKKRKYLKTLKCDQILKIGKCESDGFERTCAGIPKRQIVFLTPNREPSKNKNFYYILYSSSLEKTVNIIETKTELMDLVILAAGRNKWEAR